MERILKNEMEFIFWNVNNNASAINLINSIDFTEQKRF